LLGEVAVPGAPFLAHVLTGARATDAPQVLPLTREMLGEPGAHVLAEGPIICARVCAHMR
jgi:hypothetical protein